jgi:hypothetical protein
VLRTDVGADPPRKRYGIALIEGFHSSRASSTSPDGETDSQPMRAARWEFKGYLSYLSTRGVPAVTASIGGDSCTDSSGPGSCRSSAKRLGRFLRRETVREWLSACAVRLDPCSSSDVLPSTPLHTRRHKGARPWSHDGFLCCIPRTALTA